MSPETLYTRNELVMMETSIANSHTSFYITEIQKIEFHLPHIQIQGTNKCGNTCHEAFKLCISNNYVLCHIDYDGRVVASVAQKIQSA